jgi:hypothetical protein
MFIGDISIVIGVYKPTNITFWGAPPTMMKMMLA